MIEGTDGGGAKSCDADAMVVDRRNVDFDNYLILLSARSVSNVLLV